MPFNCTLILPFAITAILVSFPSFTVQLKSFSKSENHAFFVPTHMIIAARVKEAYHFSLCLMKLFIGHQKKPLFFLQISIICFLFLVGTLVLKVSQLMEFETLNDCFVSRLSPSTSATSSSKHTSTPSSA